MRSIFIIYLFLVILHKLWPVEVLSMLLAQITLGGLLLGLLKVGVVVTVGLFLFVRLVTVPEKEDRRNWEGNWIFTGFVIVLVACVPLMYASLDKKSTIMDFVSGMILIVEDGNAVLITKSS